MDTSQLVELLEDMTREMLALWESEDYSEEAEMQLITKNTDTLAQYFERGKYDLCFYDKAYHEKNIYSTFARNLPEQAIWAVNELNSNSGDWKFWLEEESTKDVD